MLMEKEIFFNQQADVLQGRVALHSDRKASVITHPHPLYGGDMDNTIVSVIAEAYAERQWTTLRFNFRGTGRSKGSYDNGIGEQTDVQAAIDYLAHQGFEQIDVAGYSFGAWVLANWSRRHAPHPHRLRFVAPPVAFVNFENQRPIPGLQHIFVGSRDDLAPLDQIESARPAWQPEAELHVIQDADHFFDGFTAVLKAEFSAALNLS